MKKSVFDKIVILFLFLFLVVFILVILFSTGISKQALIDERIDVLSNEGVLIAEQTVSRYIQGNLNLEETRTNMQYYSNSLNVSLWILDADGNIIAATYCNNHPHAPDNIYQLSDDFDILSAKSFTGDFYGMFEDDVISVSVPIMTNGIPSGMLIIHSTMGQLSSIQSSIAKTIYVPFLIMLIISISLLGIISNKIVRPLKKINTIAEEYSHGNFESKLNIKSEDEIGQLADTMEYMASELSKLDEYRKDFISNISHDFRSPLTSIKGYVEAIQDGTIPPEKQDKYLKIIVDETKRLTKLTSSLLELNNYDSYGIWLVLKDFDIVDLTKKAMRVFEGKCEDKHISLILNNHCTSGMVTGDKTKIQQVIYNLLDNAIKFTPPEKNIYVTLSEKGDKIFVSIKDEGCGISKDSLNKIWTRFYKVDTSRGKDKGGTGLGLSITREIIKAHNENINVVSTEGVGSEFTFTLKRSSSAEEPNTDEPQS